MFKLSEKYSSSKLQTAVEEFAALPSLDLPRLAVRVSRAAESAIRGGHPWVYSNSVSSVKGEEHTGQLAIIFDKKNRFLAVGLYDSESPLRIRVLHVGKSMMIDRDFFDRRIEECIDRRKGFFDGTTTGHRWIHGESDNFPGLVVDRYSTTLVIKIYTAAWLPYLSTVVDLLRTKLSPESAVLRLSRNIMEACAEHGLADGQQLFGPTIDGPLIFQEDFLVNPL
ncbi:hypothetical protein CYMTET_46517 [Cymbomonas tetramitiformis]|uniref:PUA domain-containing protein n=1 Tax=Cymbomonas tetramitiformis TaxID=36881 RepID=A0AAE0EXI4_9CHLO|nr:hypothetical protein CYMTET_46517 [Cymbomonas tetramitiformis]